MSQSAAEEVVLKDSFQDAQQASESHVATINNLPNEILREIFYHATMNDSLPRRYHTVAAGDIQPDARQWKTAMVESQVTAHAISLISHRFNENAKSFFFREILLVRNELDIRDWAGKSDAHWALRSTWQVREAQRLGTYMKRLRDVLKQNPAYEKYCTSLCLVSSRVWVPPANEDDNGEVDGHGEIGSDDHGTQPESFDNGSSVTYPERSILHDIYVLLNNVTDFQIHCDNTTGTPDFTVALSLLPTINIIRVTGQVHYLSIFKQLSRHVPQDSSLQTLDLSEATCSTYEVEAWHRAAPYLRTFQEASGTAPFTRLLTSPEMGTRQLEILLAWPKRLERLALQTNTQQLSDDVERGTLQKPLDIVKDTLRQLRIEGDDELGLGGFDLRAFPCLEHLALCTATISNYNQNPRDGTKLPELDLHIFAPRLRSLLWVLPWWERKQPKVKDFFGKKHEDRLRGLLQKAVEVKRAREVEGKEWCFERVWLQTIRVPLETLTEKAGQNFEKDLNRIKGLDDEFKGEGIRVRHLPFPRSSTGAERRFPRLEEVWDWDERALRRY